MSVQPIQIVRLDEVCRSVAPDEFDPRAPESLMVRYPEDPPSVQPPEMIGFKERYFRGGLVGLRQRLYDEGENTDGEYVRIFSEIYTPDRYDTYVAHLRDARIIPDVCAILDSNNNFLYPNTYSECSDEDIAYYYFYRSRALTSTIVVNRRQPRFEHRYGFIEDDSTPLIEVMQPHILIANQSASTYAHFIAEIVPRLWVFDKFPQLRELPIIVDQRNQTFVGFLQELIGVPRSQLVGLEPGKRYRFKHLIHPSGVCDRGYTRKKFRFVRNLVLRGQEVPESTGRRFYLTRKTGGFARRLQNEAEVQAVAERYGFEVMEAGDLTLVEQAKLFAQADIIMGPTGAALTNMAFMHPRKAVIELSSQDWMRDFWRMVGTCDLKHIVVASECDYYMRDRANWWMGWGNPHMMSFDPALIAQGIEAAIKHVTTAAPEPEW